MQAPWQSGWKDKHTAPFGWRWALICGAATLICYFSGLSELAHALFWVTVVLGAIAEITSRFALSKGEKYPDIPDTTPEEFDIHFPDPTETGWLNYTLTPSKNAYKEDLCFGGPPVDISTYEYTVKVDKVFSRLIDLREKDIYSVQYEVVNGQVLEDDIRSRKPYASTDEHIEHLKKVVAWNEITGSLRYFILSKHGNERSLFSHERQRLETGFASLAEKAAQLGGVREPGGHYKPLNDGDEQCKAALRDLQQTTRLERFGISFRELRDYEHIIQTLEDLTPN